MKSNQLAIQNENQSKIKQVQLLMNKKVNKASVQKMKNLLAQSILKKSSQLVNIAPFMFSSIQSKALMHHKSITESKKSVSKIIEKPKSPKKTSLGSPKAKPKSQLIDLQQKRRRIYGMPYLLQLNQSNPFQAHEELNKFALIPKSSQNQTIFTIDSQRKVYTQTISTTYSVKQLSQLKIKDFDIGKILGYGKFGHVYMARHKKSGFMCALKQIKREGMDQILQNQLIRQIKIQMYLNHPNIVKLYTFFFDATHIYLVLQLCSSGQLYNFLKKNQPIKEDLAKVIIRQICQGIDYIHQNHIIHRDLKPQNILYHNSMLKICDFGWSIATPLMRDTFCGTPLYVSPQLLKRNYYNNKVDIWSIGILAYEILIGQVPFQIFCEADYVKILKNQVKFPKNTNISQQAKDFIDSCLQKDPQKRLTSSQLLEHPFLKKVQLINFPQIY